MKYHLAGNSSRKTPNTLKSTHNFWPMAGNPDPVDDYVSKLPPERKEAVSKLLQVFRKNLPKGFKETGSYGMLGYVVPKTIYPAGYHCDPKLPLPFINIASQKNFV